MSANEKQVGGEHYKTPMQHWDYVIANNMPYLDAQAFRYIDRHARKNGREDLEKAIHYIEKMIEVYYPEPEVLELRPGDPQDCKHSWSHVYKHGPEGRLVEIMKCDLCQTELPKV